MSSVTRILWILMNSPSRLGSNPTPLSKLLSLILELCGERGIRTLGTLAGYTRFPGVPVQPLLHLSELSAFLHPYTQTLLSAVSYKNLPSICLYLNTLLNFAAKNTKKIRNTSYHGKVISPLRDLFKRILISSSPRFCASSTINFVVAASVVMS